MAAIRTDSAPAILPGPPPPTGSALPESLRTVGFGTAAPDGAIKKVRYSHDGMIDLIIAKPWISQNEIAAHFGYTAPWVSQVFCSDIFQARLAERKEELVDPAIRATIEEKFKALVDQSFRVLQEKLARPANQISDDLALRSIEIASKALGYGSKVVGGPTVVQNSFVVHVPAKAESSQGWAKEAAQRATEMASGNSSGKAPPESSIEDATYAEGPALAPLAPAAPALSAVDGMLEELRGR